MKKRIARSRLSKPAAALFGVALAAAACAAIEIFFQINEKMGWIPPLYYKSAPWRRIHDLSELPLGSLKNLRPYPEVSDKYEPDDYSTVGIFPNCAGTRPEEDRHWIGIPDCRGRSVLRKAYSRRPVYDAVYTFDGNARRIIPDATEGHRRFILYLGCSLTFGEGVADAATFPNLIAQRERGVNAYNLGMCGYGPNNVLQLLRRGKSDHRLAGIRGAHGTAVYTFIDDHLRRLMGTMSWLENFEDEPYFLKEGDRLVQRGTLQTGRPVLTKLYRLLARSAFIRFLRRDIPRSTPEDFDLFAAVLGECKKILERDFGVDRFIFAVFPGERIYVSQLRPRLERQGIVVLDFSDVDPKTLARGRATFLGNLHLSEVGYELYADLFLYELKKKGISLR